MAKFEDPGHYTAKDREKIKHFAGPNSTYPIEVPKDVHDAAVLVGHADDPAAVKAKIISIAHQLGPEFVAQLPDTWTSEGEGRAASAEDERQDERTWQNEPRVPHGAGGGEWVHAHPHTHKNGVQHSHSHVHHTGGKHHGGWHHKKRADDVTDVADMSADELGHLHDGMDDNHEHQHGAANGQVIDSRLIEQSSEQQAPSRVASGAEETRMAKKMTRSQNTNDEQPEQVIEQVAYAPIVRIDQEKREVSVCATSEAVDSYKTRFGYEASKDAFSRWYGNIREMHDRKAVGRRVALNFDDANRRVYVTARVSRGAQDTWEKILDGTLQGASIGASNVVWEKPIARSGEEPIPTATRYDLVELSFVDSPSNPDARGIQILRAAMPDADLLDEIDEVDGDNAYRAILAADATRAESEVEETRAETAEEPTEETERHTIAAPATRGRGGLTSAMPAMPAGTTAAPAPVQRVMMPLSAQQEEYEAKLARQYAIRKAGDAAQAEMEPQGRDESRIEFERRRADVRGKAEAAYILGLNAPTSQESAPVVEATETRAEEPEAAAPVETPAEAAPAPVTRYTDGATPVMTTRMATADGEITSAHTHADGKRHTHAYLSLDHTHIYRNRQPLDTRLAQADAERAPFGENPSKSGVMAPGSLDKGKSVSPVVSVQAQNVGFGGKSLYNTQDALALEAGVPPAAEERPTPEEDITLDAGMFHEGGHAPRVPGSHLEGHLPNGDEAARPRAGAMPKPSAVPAAARPTPGSVLTPGGATDGGRASGPSLTRASEEDDGDPDMDADEDVAPGVKKMMGGEEEKNDENENEENERGIVPAATSIEYGDHATPEVGKDPANTDLDISEQGPQMANAKNELASSKDMKTSSPGRSAEADEERIGARISAESRAAIHDMRNAAADALARACQHCSCPDCARILAVHNGGDFNGVGTHDTDLAVNASQDTATFGQSRMIASLVERAVASLLEQTIATLRAEIAGPILARVEDAEMTLLDQSSGAADSTRALEAQVTSAFTSYTTSLPGLLETRMADALSAQVAPIAQRLDTLAASFAGVAGDVERIANQPVPTSAVSGITDKQIPFGSPSGGSRGDEASWLRTLAQQLPQGSPALMDIATRLTQITNR